MASRTKQAKKLKKDAQRLWVDQQALLGRANSLAQTAWPSASKFATGTVVPGAKTIYADRVGPAIGKGAVAGKAAGVAVGSTTRDAVRGTVLPAVSSAASAALALANEGSERLGISGAKNASAVKALNATTKSGQRSEAKARVKLKAAGKAGRAATKAGKAAAASGAARAAKKAGGNKGGIGAGGVVGIVLGAVVVGGIAYAVWQTLRADDDLWVADEDPETTSGTDAPTV